jgi:hypothetical protein
LRRYASAEATAFAAVQQGRTDWAEEAGMKYSKVVALMEILLVPAMAWAGGGPIRRVPTLGDAGLIALGVGLVTVGAAFLRRR